MTKRKILRKFPITPLLPYITRVGEVGGSDDGHIQSGVPYILAPGKMTQVDLAKKLGVSRRTICRWLTDGMNVNDFERVAHLLGVHPITLLGRSTYMEYFIHDDTRSERQAPFHSTIRDDPVLGEEVRRHDAGPSREATEALERDASRISLAEGVVKVRPRAHIRQGFPRGRTA